MAKPADIKSFLGVSKLRDENRDYFESEEFVRSIAHYNLIGGIAVSAVVCLLGLAGLVGNTLISPNNTVFPSFPNMAVYLLLLAVNVPHIALFLWWRRLRKKPELFLRFELVNLCLNAMLAGLTILDTEVGSSFFLEFVIISIAVYVLPYIRRGKGVLISAVSVASLMLFIVILQRDIAWQDCYDIFLFYGLCWASMIMRRRWFDSTRLLSHQLESANRGLVTRGRTDELTGLLNRAALRDDFSSIRGPRTFFAMLDMDDFKSVNDRFGHERGDIVLRELGQTLASRFDGENERCYRYGGDEFLIVAIDVDEQDIVSKLKEILRVQSENTELGSPESISAGYCYGVVENERNARSFLRIADDNLYLAKTEGKNRVVGQVFHLGTTAPNGASDNPNLIDPLTEIYNYAGFEQVLRRRADSLFPGSIVFFDIDRFQDLNKTFGYRTGNDVLCEIARLIMTNFSNFVACRYDTDHFALYTSDNDPLSAAKAVQGSIAHFVPHFYVFLRIGIYQLEPGISMDGLASAVDKAKYASDTLRRQHALLYCYYDDKLALEREREAYVLGHFDEAIENGGIVPYFQPVITLSDGKCHGFEALARWYDPGGGMLPPGIFVPVLEKSYDSFRLDSHMLDRACALLETLPRDTLEHAYVSFNVSRNDFAIDDVPEAIDRIVTAHHIPPSCIRVEVTESVLNDGSEIRRALTTLHSRGYQIWLDDFGSGESSLNILTNYEIDGAKLDQGFLLDSVPGNDKSRTIVQALVQLCHTIGVNVVVEGVETQEQLDFVRRCGGDIAQGFFFSKPLPIDQLVESPFWKGLGGGN